MTWRTIDSAPRDNEVQILTWMKYDLGYQIVWWRHDIGRWQTQSETTWSADAFTHWHPLPAPPGAEGVSDE